MHFSQLICESVPAFGQRLCFIGLPPSYEFISLAGHHLLFLQVYFVKINLILVLVKKDLLKYFQKVACM